MNICSNRLETFTQHEPPWPFSNDSSYHAPEEFANAGFYNVSTKRIIDKVQCYLCNITLADWKQGQSPLGRHAHAAKTCPLVLLNFPGALTTIPIVEKDANTHPESEFMIKTRLKTFTKNRAWPPSLVTDDDDTQPTQKRQTYPTSTRMAEAGFVFLPTLNEPDRVKCPYCQYCLSNLNATSNPWAQHQKAKPDCLYVTRRKATLPTKRSSLPQKRSIPTGPSTSTTKKSRRATTNSHDKENAAAKPVNDQDDLPATDDTTNEAGLLSRFDDSIWDIAKAQLDYKKAPDLATATRQRPSNGKPLVTYERKKKKRPSNVLPPELTKPTASSSTAANSKRFKETATTSRTKKQQHQNQAAPKASQQKEAADETPAQVLARLQKKPIEPISTRDKGKGRASDFTPETPLLPAPPTTNKLTKDSLRLSTGKNTTERSSSGTTPSESASAAEATAVSATATTTESISHATNEPRSSQEQSYKFFASTPSSQRRSNINASTPLPHSTPIHSRIDHGNDLMALTLSPIRGAGNMTTNATQFVDSVFGSLDTPMTTIHRTGQRMDEDDDIGLQIEQRFRAKRRLGSPTRSSPQRTPTTTTTTTTTKVSDTDYTRGASILDFDDSDEIVPPPQKQQQQQQQQPQGTTGTGNATGEYLTEEQLVMTVEEYIQSLVESKVALVKQHGEQLIKNIKQEVADTKKSLLTNHS